MRKTTKPQLTDKEKSALKQYAADPKISRTEAVARSNFDVTTRGSAQVIASKLFNKPAAQRFLEEQAERAANNIVDIANDKDIRPEVRLKANQDILDRSDGKATQRSINQSQTVKIIADFTGGQAGPKPVVAEVVAQVPETSTPQMQETPAAAS